MTYICPSDLHKCRRQPEREDLEGRLLEGQKTSLPRPSEGEGCRKIQGSEHVLPQTCDLRGYCHLWRSCRPQQLLSLRIGILEHGAGQEEKLGALCRRAGTSWTLLGVSSSITTSHHDILPRAVAGCPVPPSTSCTSSSFDRPDSEP